MYTGSSPKGAYSVILASRLAILIGSKTELKAPISEPFSAPRRRWLGAQSESWAYPGSPNERDVNIPEKFEMRWDSKRWGTRLCLPVAAEALSTALNLKHPSCEFAMSV